MQYKPRKETIQMKKTSLFSEEKLTKVFRRLLCQQSTYGNANSTGHYNITFALFLSNNQKIISDKFHRQTTVGEYYN